MNKFVIQVVRIILFAWCSDITVIIEVAFLYAIDCAEETIAADVKLSFLNQKGPFDIFLNYEGWIVAEWSAITILNDGFDLFKSAADLNSITTIGVFSRFDDPNIF